MTRRLALVVGALCCLLYLSGCAPQTDYSARFVRYDPAGGEPLVAVVSPIAVNADSEQLAFTDLEDLKAGEVVYIRFVGKDWDQPQSAPEREIVGRARRP